MSPNRLDLSDPLQVAVKVTTIEGSLTMLQQQLGNVSNRMDSAQIEQRETFKVVSDVARQLHDLQSHSEGLNRVAKSIEQQGLDFQAWKRDHELENKAVADRVTTFRGMLLGFGLLASVVMGLAAAWVNVEFKNVRQEAVDRSRYDEKDRNRIEAKHDQDVGLITSEIREIKQTRGLK